MKLGAIILVSILLIGAVVIFNPAFTAMQIDAVGQQINYISSCQVLDEAGASYYLTQNISDPTPGDPCIRILANSITLDCQNFAVTGNSSWGIDVSSADNAVVRNCKVYGFVNEGIHFSTSNFGLVEYNDVSNSPGGHGIVISRDSHNNTVRHNIANNNFLTGLIPIESTSYYNTFHNNTARGNLDHGMEIEHGAHHNYFINNTILDNQWSGIKLSPDTHSNIIQGNFINRTENQGINVDNSSNNVIEDNYVIGNPADAVNIGGNSSGNTIHNNILVDSGISGVSISESRESNITNNTINTAGLGVFLRNTTDIVVSRNVFENVMSHIHLDNGSVNVFVADNLPEETQIPISQPVNVSSCQILDQWGATYYLTQNISDPTPGDPCMRVISDSITLDCQDFILTGNSSWGIDVSGADNVVVKKCKVYEFVNAGIRFSGSSFGTLENNDVSNSPAGHGIVISSDSHNNTIRHNTANDNNLTGLIAIEATSYYNTFHNNSATGNRDHGMEIENGAHHNYFIDNTVVGSAFTGIKLSPGSDYNIIRGNFINKTNNQGINIEKSNNNIVEDNHIVNNPTEAITIGTDSSGNTIQNNQMEYFERAISVVSSTDTVITDNVIKHGTEALFLLEGSSGIIVSGNTMENISTDVHTHGELSNITAFNNLFVGEYQMVSVVMNWHNGSLGNRWLSYDEPSEGCEDADSDGICDSPYGINEQQADDFPIALVTGAVSPPAPTPSPPSSGGGGGGSGGGGSGGGTTQPDTKTETVSHKPGLSRARGLTENKKLQEAVKKVLAKEKLSEEAKENLLDLSEAIVKGTKVTREAVKEKGKTSVKTKIKYTGKEEIKNYMIHEVIPKSFAKKAGDITVTAPGATVEVVNPDPEYLITYPELKPGDEVEITYSINKEVDPEISKNITTELYAESFKEIEQKICAPGNLTCDGDLLKICSEDGLAWETKTNCTYGCGAAGCKEMPKERKEIPAAKILIILLAAVFILLILYANRPKGR